MMSGPLTFGKGAQQSIGAMAEASKVYSAHKVEQLVVLNISLYGYCRTESLTGLLDMQR